MHIQIMLALCLLLFPQHMMSVSVSSCRDRIRRHSWVPSFGTHKKSATKQFLLHKDLLDPTPIRTHPIPDVALRKYI